MPDPVCLESLSFGGSRLMIEHPPLLRHPHKRLAFEQCCQAGYSPGGTLKYSRWKPERFPESIPSKDIDVVVDPAFFSYPNEAGEPWHVNFADPELFVAYGSGLLAQDEIQVLEHPILGSLREALDASGWEALTEDRSGPTPILIQGAERACRIDTSPSTTSPRGLYGNRFQAATPEAVLAALHVFPRPTMTNLIAMAAPVGSGLYSNDEISRILTTAYTGFRAAVLASSSRPVVIHTGFWGCGAFGGNRPLMVLLQLLAAQLAAADRLVFHLGSVAEQPPFDEGQEILRKVTRTESSTQEILNAIAKRGFQWGQSDGN